MNTLSLSRAVSLGCALFTLFASSAGLCAQSKPEPANEQSAAETEKKNSKPKENIVSFKVDFNGKSEWIKIRLDDKHAPRHCQNFRELVDEGFYEDMLFHRVIRNYLVQTGDPLTRDESQKRLWGTGDIGYSIPAEPGLPHRRGSVGMARLRSGNSKKASSGCQFYIMLSHAPQLDGDYTVFGNVIQGLDTIERMSRVQVDTNDLPVEKIEVASCRLGEPGVLAAMTKPLDAIPTPKMPKLGNPLSAVKNPFKKEENPADTADADANAELLKEFKQKNKAFNEQQKAAAAAAKKSAQSNPAPDAAPDADADADQKKRGPFGRLIKKIW